MKGKILPKLIVLLLALLSPAAYLLAQCNCNQPDPKGYSSTSCGLAEPYIGGASTICSTASSCSSGTDYTYTVDFSTNVTGYFWKITGGFGYRELIYINGVSTIDRNNCGTNSCGNVSTYQCREYGNPNAVYRLTIYVRWTNPGSGNKIELWGYTGISNGYPATLTYYKCFPVTMSSPPGTPTGISLSSPTYYPCGWKVASSYVSNATSYNWSGAGYGSYSDITGPPIAGNQTAYICVNASNGCGTSPNYCAYVTIPRNSACQRLANGDTIMVKKDPGPGANPTAPEAKASRFSVSPNPAHGRLHVTFDKPGRHDVTLVSALGHMAKEIAGIESGQVDIDVATLAKGIYLLTIYENGQAVTRKKIVIE